MPEYPPPKNPRSKTGRSVVGSNGHWPTAHPLFEPGNNLAQRHGAHFIEARGLAHPAVAAKFENVMAHAQELGSPTAYLLDASYRDAIVRYCVVDAMIDACLAYLIENDDLAGLSRKTRGAANRLDRLMPHSERLGARLGLDPLSRARLGRDVAGAQIDLARLWAEEPEHANDD